MSIESEVVERELRLLYKSETLVRVLDVLASLERAHKQSDAYSLATACEKHFRPGETVIHKREIPSAKDVKHLFHELEKLGLGRRINSRRFQWARGCDPRTVGLIAQGNFDGGFDTINELLSPGQGEDGSYDLTEVPTAALLAEIQRRTERR